MKSDESADGPTSDILNSGPELPLLSQRQCRLICEQLRKNHVCLEECFSALMHGSSSQFTCVCVLEVGAARDSPVTNGLRQRLHEISAAQRW